MLYFVAIVLFAIIMALAISLAEYWQVIATCVTTCVLLVGGLVVSAVFSSESLKNLPTETQVSDIVTIPGTGEYVIVNDDASVTYATEENGRINVHTAVSPELHTGDPSVSVTVAVDDRDVFTQLLFPVVPPPPQVVLTIPEDAP